MVASYQSLEAASVKIHDHDESISTLKTNVYDLAIQVNSIGIILKNSQKDIENIYQSSIIVSEKIDSFKNDLIEKISVLEKYQEGWKQKYLFYVSSLPKFFGIVFLISFFSLLAISIIDSHYSLDSFIKFFNKIF